MTLVTELPIIIGDRISYDDKRWISVLILIKLCKIALAPTCTKDMICYLRLLIEEKLLSKSYIQKQKNFSKNALHASLSISNIEAWAFT